MWNAGKSIKNISENASITLTSCDVFRNQSFVEANRLPLINGFKSQPESKPGSYQTSTSDISLEENDLEVLQKRGSNKSCSCIDKSDNPHRGPINVDQEPQDAIALLKHLIMLHTVFESKQPGRRQKYMLPRSTVGTGAFPEIPEAWREDEQDGLSIFPFTRRSSPRFFQLNGNYSDLNPQTSSTAQDQPELLGALVMAQEFIAAYDGESICLSEKELLTRTRSRAPREKTAPHKPQCGESQSERRSAYHDQQVSTLRLPRFCNFWGLSKIPLYGRCKWIWKI